MGIKCIGNIENLLDYQTVLNGEHPVTGERCYSNMFYDCASLIQAPELPAITLVYGCYSYMFQHCTSLIQAPELPATTLADVCYREMFYDCTSLTQAPDLPATTLANNCYEAMFSICKSLTGTIHCPKSVENNAQNITKKGSLPSTVTVVYDL